MKRILCLVIVALLMLTMAPFALAEEKPTIKVALPVNPLVTDYEDNYFTNWVEEVTGYEIEFIFLPAGDDTLPKLNMMIAGGEDLGDVVYTTLNQITLTQLADAGGIVDLAPYMTEDTNIVKFANEIGEDIVSAIKTANGEIWGYPAYYPETNNMTKYRAWINTVWLDNLGLEMPTTTDELFDVLMAFKTEDANGNGDPNDEIPMLGATNSWSADPTVYLTNAFVYHDGDAGSGQLLLNDGVISAMYTQPEYKEALKFINKLVANGLLAPETWTISEGQYREYLSTEIPTVGVLFYTHLGFVGPTDENKNEYQYMPYLTGPEGKQYVSYQPYNVAANIKFFVPASAEDPQKSFDFIDALFTEEAYIRARFGVEDVHYEKVDDAEVLEILKSNHPYAILENDQGWGETNNMSWQDNMGCYTGASWMCQWNGDPNYYFYKRVVAVDDMMSKVPAVGEYVPALTYDEEETEIVNDLKPDIETYRSEMSTRFILGELDIDAEWDEYVNTLVNDLKLEEYLAAQQSAYDRMYGAN